MNVMPISLRNFSSLVVLVAAIGFQSTAIAQPTRVIPQQANETLAETFTRAFFKNDPDFFRNRSFKRQLDWILGPGSVIRNSFPENEITRDAAQINTLYRTALEQQASNDPPIRTRDLPNPYESSILVSPYNVNNPVERNEMLFERQQTQ